MTNKKQSTKHVSRQHAKVRQTFIKNNEILLQAYFF